MTTAGGKQAASVSAPSDAFHFGRNWQRYASHYLDADRERIAAESLAELIGDLTGKTFLDIGSGSGLFSLCAYRSGASQVVSVDVDADAIATANQLRAQAGSPDTWRVVHGSILDADLVLSLEPADVVYSWGVLHHTGDMYRAMRNAASLVKQDGCFAVAIYNRVAGRWLSSERWRHIKRAYNHTSRSGQCAMRAAYVLYWILASLRHGKSPIREAGQYRRMRGMALWTDQADWLGGYPYEFATADEIIAFCEGSLGLVCSKVIPSSGTGNNQFVFDRPRS